MEIAFGLVYKIVSLLVGVAFMIFGYRLYLRGIAVTGTARERGEFTLSLGKDKHIKLAHAGPGIFLALFGMLIVIAVIAKGVSFEKDKDGFSFEGVPVDPPEDPEPIDPSDFFPTATGTTWTYEIELVGDQRFLKYEQVAWPQGQGNLVYSTRGIIYSPSEFKKSDDESDDSKSYTLELAVKGPAKEQGQLKYPKGVELAINQDDVGIFERTKQVFWAVTDSGRFTANLVVTYSPDSPGAPRSGGFGTWGQGDGSAMRLFFFTDKPGIGIGLKGSPDSLIFKGVRRDVPGYEKIDCLYFTRVVEAAEKTSTDRPGTDQLNKAFTEDMWFARGKGLVRLEQEVEDEPTMNWTLTSFKAGESQ